MEKVIQRLTESGKRFTELSNEITKNLDVIRFLSSFERNSNFNYSFDIKIHFRI